MKIVIKKQIGLEFLGEAYKDSYLTFRTMPLREYEEILPTIEAIGEDGKKSLNLIKTVLEDHFIEGKFEGEAVAKEDLQEFDLDTLTRCFQLFTGQADPKVPSS